MEVFAVYPVDQEPETGDELTPENAANKFVRVNGKTTAGGVVFWNGSYRELDALTPLCVDGDLVDGPLLDLLGEVGQDLADGLARLFVDGHIGLAVGLRGTTPSRRWPRRRRRWRMPTGPRLP